MTRVFKNRKNAGVELGLLLHKTYKDRNPLVLGLAPGGVEVAFSVGKILHGDLDVILSKKLPFPGHEELTFGAVSEDGSVFLSALSCHLSRGVIYSVIADQLEVLNHQLELYRNGNALPDMNERLVVLVDDGMATGYHLVPALMMCRAKGAATLVVAVPVAGEEFLPQISELADDVQIVLQADEFYATGQAYECFPVPTDEHVVMVLQKFHGIHV